LTPPTPTETSSLTSGSPDFCDFPTSVSPIDDQTLNMFYKKEKKL